MPTKRKNSPATLTIMFMAILGCSNQAAVDNQSSEESNAPSASSDSSAESPSSLKSEVTEPSKLKIGAVAPKIEIAQWIQGQPVEGFQPGHTYVVEFWATWCGPCKAGMPHMSSLQDQYEGKVTFIGVTNEDESTVTNFLGQTQNRETGDAWSEVVTYALALDSDQATNNAYMKAAEQDGIPTAFVVGPDAHIEWIGHPANIDGPLEQIVLGTWDRDEYLARYEEEQRKAKAMYATMLSLQQASKEGDWDRAIREIDNLIEQNPEQLFFAFQKLSYLQSAKRFEEAVTLAEQLAKEGWENSRMLNAIAWMLAAEQSEPPSRLEVALRLAKRASELLQDQDAATLDTLARVHYELGNLEDAIAWQEKAVELGQDIDGLEVTLQKYLTERDGDGTAPQTPAQVDGEADDSTEDDATEAEAAAESNDDAS